MCLFMPYLDKTNEEMKLYTVTCNNTIVTQAHSNMLVDPKKKKIKNKIKWNNFLSEKKKMCMTASTTL